MPFEKPDPITSTYPAEDGNQYPLVTGTYYRGHQRTPHALDIGTVENLFYWDGVDFMTGHGGTVRNVSAKVFDYFVPQTVSEPARPTKDATRLFTDAVLAKQKDIGELIQKDRLLLTVYECHKHGSEAFGSHDYLSAFVWFMNAAQRSFKTQDEPLYAEAAANCHEMAFAKFCTEQRK